MGLSEKVSTPCFKKNKMGRETSSLL